VVYHLLLSYPVYLHLLVYVEHQIYDGEKSIAAVLYYPLPHMPKLIYNKYNMTHEIYNHDIYNYILPPINNIYTYILLLTIQIAIAKNNTTLISFILCIVFFMRVYYIDEII